MQSHYGVTLKKDIVGISSVRQTILPLISSKHEGNITEQGRFVLVLMFSLTHRSQELC